MSKFDLILPRGKEQVLKAEDKDYDRGLLVELLSDGGYEVAYWYDKEEPYPIEVLVDGESVKKDAKKVTFKFHPKMEEKRVNESQEIMGSFQKYIEKRCDSLLMNEEGIRNWFAKSKSKDGKSGWVDVVDGDACAREKGETATPKCVSSAKRESMTKKEREAAQAKKRREDPNQPKKKNAAKPTNVKTDIKEQKDKPGKGSGTKDACYHKVKSRYKVWPSAYASGALVKCRKVGAKNWGNSTKKESYNFKSFAEFLTS